MRYGEKRLEKKQRNMKKSAIGIDNYCLHPLRLAPLEVMEWAKGHGAEGVQFSGIDPLHGEKMDDAYLRDLSGYASANDLYLEWGGAQHIPFDTKTWQKKDIAKINEKVAGQAALIGTSVVRSCSGGMMRWDPHSPMTESLLDSMAESLREQRQMLMDNNVILAIETHFEFTTHELLRMFDRCGALPGEYLGICLDTMNLLTMLEDPVFATQRILPWVVCTHVKDGAVFLDETGLTTFPVEIGKGVIDLKRISGFLGRSSGRINLTIEDHGGEFFLPVFDPLFLSRFPDLTAEEFTRILRLALRTEKKKKSGDLSITAREDWPDICESRVHRDIRSLEHLLS